MGVIGKPLWLMMRDVYVKSDATGILTLTKAGLQEINKR